MLLRHQEECDMQTPLRTGYFSVEFFHCLCVVLRQLFMLHMIYIYIIFSLSMVTLSYMLTCFILMPFASALLNYSNHCRNSDLPTIRQGNIDERTQWTKCKI